MRRHANALSAALLKRHEADVGTAPEEEEEEHEEQEQGADVLDP